MKASIKLRDQKPPLFRVNLPISIPIPIPILNLTSSLTTSTTPSDLTLSLKSPSLHLHLRPNNPTSPLTLTLTLTLRSSPLTLNLSTSISPTTPPSFSLSLALALALRIGDFKIKKTTPLQTPNPNPNPHQNGAGVYHPIPFRPSPPGEGRIELEEFISNSCLSLLAYTSVPVIRNSGFKIRWGLDFPNREFRVDKVSFEVGNKGKLGDLRRDDELEVMSEMRMCVSELERENRVIREGIRQVWRNVAERRRGEEGGIGEWRMWVEGRMEARRRFGVGIGDDCVALEQGDIVVGK